MCPYRWSRYKDTEMMSLRFPLYFHKDWRLGASFLKKRILDHLCWLINDRRCAEECLKIYGFISFFNFISLKNIDCRLASVLWRFNSYLWRNWRQHHVQGPRLCMSVYQIFVQEDHVPRKTLRNNKEKQTWEVYIQLVSSKLKHFESENIALSRNDEISNGIVSPTKNYYHCSNFCIPGNLTTKQCWIC